MVHQVTLQRKMLAQVEGDVVFEWLLPFTPKGFPIYKENQN